MSITSRQKRPLDRTVEHERDTNIIVVATEGAKTEKLYFEIFKTRKVQIFVIPNIEDKSSPKHIKDNLDNYVQEYQIGEGDQLWLAIDVDRWKQQELSTICQECLQKGYQLAISNPCFELWLLYHFQDVVENYSSCNGVKDILKPLLDKAEGSNYEELFLDLAANAVERARTADNDETQRWPHPQGTRVYQIIEQIL